MTHASKRRDTDAMKLIMADFHLNLINEDNMHAFFLQFHGPKDSFYHGYVWWLKVELPVEYPNKPPLINFANKIFHPNIHEGSGGICFNLLNKSWSPETNLVPVFEHYIPQLLKYPNPGDPYNMDAASLLLSDPAAYKARVKDYCESFATPEEVSSMETDDDVIEEMSEEDLLDETDAEIHKLAIDEGEDNMLAETDRKMGKLAIEEGKDDNAFINENVSGKADDPFI